MSPAAADSVPVRRIAAITSFFARLFEHGCGAKPDLALDAPLVNREVLIAPCSWRYAEPAAKNAEEPACRLSMLDPQRTTARAPIAKNQTPGGYMRLVYGLMTLLLIEQTSSTVFEAYIFPTLPPACGILVLIVLVFCIQVAVTKYI